MIRKVLAMVVIIAVAVSVKAAVVDITGAGRAKFTVSINVANNAFASSLKKNLERSGAFIVKQDGSIKVSGASGSIKAEGGGKVVSSPDTFTDDKSARMAARRLSDTMCQAYANQKGFACDKIIFLNRGKAINGGVAIPGEICVAYPDGYDIRQLTSDGATSLFPRWKTDGESIYYIGYMRGAPQIWEMNTVTGKRNVKWSFKGSPTGVAVSPDGRKVAAILSIHGNPELYVLEGDRYIRLTNTPTATEGQPTWSPDGKKIAYVSDETRRAHIYVIDVATKQKRRLTSKGRENVDPDWGKDGRIAYITKRGGAQIAVMNSAEGDKTASLVTGEANWEHPSWARDSRTIVANRDRALFIIDTEKANDKPVPPVQMFHANGNWISPSWSK